MLLRIIIASQCLQVFEDGQCLSEYPVSTGLKGIGQQQGSGQTPLGMHRIRIKIGGDAPLGAVFVGRRQTGEIYTPALAATHPQRDWILTRILWLTGCERGLNRGGQVDTLRRYIYIHGTPDTEPMGIPRSHGCIRMQNQDIIKLFNQVEKGCCVEICRDIPHER